ncbi:MAG: aldo/keto reductase [Planctomycetaceae bacterium]|jgi:predicted aldo/keto reductase-like oxidoreductase|nr:aldo/keto reductase [Planctomycetaceae bacterium]
MQYRTFGSGQSGKNQRKVSVLGFGCMRLPTDNGKMDGVINEKEAARIVRYGIDRGINYIDTAKVYLGGQCEAVLGRILQDGYREKVSIATKLPTWEIGSVKDADRIFSEQLRDLKTDKIDMYLIHNLQRSFHDILLKNKLADWAWKKKEKGFIDYVGFSFHDDFHYLKEVVDSFDRWEFCQLQYNYAGENAQAGTKGVTFAAEKNLSLVIMEPLLGGALATPTGKMGRLFASKEGKKFQPADLALRWLWNRKEVTVVLSGMSGFDQVKQNIDSAEKGLAGGLTEEETAFVKQLQQAYDESMPIKCTKCEYCKKDCPAGVDIPLNFDYYNNHMASAEINQQKKAEVFLAPILYKAMKPEQRADRCADCGNCETLCPQHLPIRKLLADVHRVLNG